MTAPNFDTALEQLQLSGWGIAAPMFLSLWQNSPQDLKSGLMAGVGLAETGREAEGAALLSFLSDQNPIIRTAQFTPGLAPALQHASKSADKIIRKTFSQIQRGAIASCPAPGRISTALWPQTHDGPVPYKSANGERDYPRPYVFFAPDLPPVEFFETAKWCRALSEQTQLIRKEYLSLMHHNTQAGQPYVDAAAALGPNWSDLKGSDDWTAVHLFKDGVRQAQAEHCPLTCHALDAVPITRQNGIPIEVFFSVLAPGTVIPPHHGLANSRVTVHLPLILPQADREDELGIRIGQHTRSWQMGEPIIFDDSFDHSAWNTTDAPRVVLIFEAWRPDMTEGEIEAVKASYEARESYLETRATLIRQLIGPSAST